MTINGRRAELLDAVARYRPADATEATHRDGFLTLLADCAAPFARSTTTGHVTASVFLTPPDASAVLLLRHAKQGRWLQPGGHCEAEDASVLAAALRELEEETGVREDDCEVRRDMLDLDIHPIPARGIESAHQHYDVRYHFVLTAPTNTLATGIFRWASTDDPEYTRGDESLRRCFRKLRALAVARE